MCVLKQYIHTLLHYCDKLRLNSLGLGLLLIYSLIFQLVFFLFHVNHCELCVLDCVTAILQPFMIVSAVRFVESDSFSSV